MLLQFSLSLLAVLVCVGDVVALAGLLTWQERAADPDSRHQRLWAGVLPGGTVLLLVLLAAVVSLILVWSPR